jgi:hypothetical protein
VSRLRLVTDAPSPPAGPPTADDMRFAVWLILDGQVRFDAVRRHPSGLLVSADAVIDGHACSYRPDTGWTCPCPDPRVDCPHTLAAGRVAAPR